MRRTLAIGAMVLAALAALAVAFWPGGEGSSTGEPSGAPVPGPGSPGAHSRGFWADLFGGSERAIDAGTQLGFLTVVSAADGQPLAGAEVSLMRVSGRSLHMRLPDVTARTDARGRAEFPALPLGDYDLTVFLPFFHTHRGDFASGATVPLDPIPVLRGQVLDAHRSPVANARVSSTGVQAALTRSGPDGRFELAVPMIDSLIAEKDGLIGLSAQLEEDDEALKAPVELVLEARETLASKVVRRSREPLAGVEVQVSVGELVLPQVTGPDGVFTYPDLEDTFTRVQLSKPEFVTVRTFADELAELEAVVLAQPVRLEGQVIELDGRPVPGATVTLEASSIRDWTEPVTADAEGRFVFADLDREQVELTALCPDERRASTRVSLPEGQTVQVKLMIPPELTPVPVEVVSVAGVPIRAFVVTATPVPARGWTSSGSQYRKLGLVRGRFQFHVEANDRWADAELDVDPRPDMPPLRFTVRGDGGVVYQDELMPERLRVLAVTPTGAPVAGAGVECHDVRGVTDLAGRFDCDVRAGDDVWPVRVMVSKDGATGTVRATGKEDLLRVVLNSNQTLRGRIVGVLPTAGVSVIVESAVGATSQDLTGNTFAIEDLPPIRHYACVVHAPTESSDDSETLGCGISEAGEELVITVGANGKLRFAAVDARGEPIAHPIIYLDRHAVDVETPGGAVEEELVPGDHIIVLNVDGSRARHEVRFTIRPGKTTDLGKLKLE